MKSREGEESVGVCGPHHVVSECGWNRRAGKQSQTEDSSASDDARTTDQAGRKSLFCGRLSQSHYLYSYSGHQVPNKRQTIHTHCSRAPPNPKFQRETLDRVGMASGGMARSRLAEERKTWRRSHPHVRAAAICFRFVSAAPYC